MGQRCFVVSIRRFNISEASLTRPINDPISIVISYSLNIILLFNLAYAAFSIFIFWEHTYRCFHKSTRRQDIPHKYTSMKEKKNQKFLLFACIDRRKIRRQKLIMNCRNTSWQLIIVWVRVRKILRRHQLAQKSRGVYFNLKSRKKDEVSSHGHFLRQDCDYGLDFGFVPARPENLWVHRRLFLCLMVAAVQKRSRHESSDRGA